MQLSLIKLLSIGTTWSAETTRIKIIIQQAFFLKYSGAVKKKIGKYEDYRAGQ